MGLFAPLYVTFQAELVEQRYLVGVVVWP